MQDIDIAKQAKLERIINVYEELGIPEEEVETYGKYKAKISHKLYQKMKTKKNGKLVLVTAINPTPLGEGKTTMSIGIADGLRKIGKKSILALREPSLGPVFGIKGGAAGGGYSQIAPMEDINLHFTGDFHAITSANNLLASLIDNHIYFGNKLEIEQIIWRRCLDLNDRQLRKIECGLSGEKKLVPREDGFDITAASEIMAILCLAEDLKDLERRLGNILIGYNKQKQPVYAKDLKAQGAMAVLLKEAINPNLVQTLENTPAIVHGGPFANIAHGCNTVIATKTALKLGDYVITEAGFGADLGAEKFFDIKCRKSGLKPDAVVCVATLKALKYHGGASKDSLGEENIAALEKGIQYNLMRHIHNLRDILGANVIVAINKYANDLDSEIQFLQKILNENKIEMSLVESWEKGGNGAIDIAKKVVEIVEKPTDISFSYDLKESVEDKIRAVATKIYGAEEIEVSEKAREEIVQIEKIGYGHLPICIAKTQYSFSDDQKNLECTKPFTIHIKDVILKTGAEFIVVLTGNIMTMPGLPKIPAAENIGIDEKGEIIGIF